MDCSTLADNVLCLRPIAESDFAALHQAANDPKLWEQHPDTERWRADRFRLFFDGALAANCAYAIEEIATGRLIGSSRYRPHPTNASAVEIGWTFLARDLWGSGYNTRVKSLMINLAFKHYEYVVFYGGADNHRSRKAIEKLGAVELTACDEQGLWIDDDARFSYVLRRDM